MTILCMQILTGVFQEKNENRSQFGMLCSVLQWRLTVV